MEAEEIKKRWQEYIENYTKKVIMTRATSMVWSFTYSWTSECEVKWALRSITTNKASGGDGIPLHLFQILNRMLWKCCTQNASKFGKLSSDHRTGKGQFSFQSQRREVKVIQSCPALCNSMDYGVYGILQTRILEWVAFHFSRGSSQTRSNTGFPHCRQILYQLIHKGSPFQRKENAKECSNYSTVALISHASKVMFKILQARLQQYMNCELPDVQAGYRKSRGTRDQIANIHWIIKKAREFQKNIYFCFID